MKLAYVCPFAHVTVIEKAESLNKRLPEEIICTSIACGCPAGMFKASIIDEEVMATHEFFTGESELLLSLEEQKYLEAGGMLIREIPSNIPEGIKKEFTATKAIGKLATFLVQNLPEEERLPDVIDTAIACIQKHIGHVHMMKVIRSKQTPVN